MFLYWKLNYISVIAILLNKCNAIWVKFMFTNFFKVDFNHNRLYLNDKVIKKM